MSNEARELHEQQRRADRAHHEGRIVWLTAEAPRLACGTPVAKHEATEMLQKSREALRYVNEHGMSTNSAALSKRAGYDVSDAQTQCRKGPSK